MSQVSYVQLSYVMPWRASEPAGSEMGSYLHELSEWCEDVIVVDGSPADAYATNAQLLGPFVRHLPPAAEHACLMGKVAGVLTGLEVARHEHVVIADDDVRYRRSELEEINSLLEQFDLVRPQNYFSPLVWHAAWDTARSLLNRAVGADYPGTLGIRRSTILGAGGYDGDVLFENLELIRTVEAAGGSVCSPLDLFVARRPPTAGHFWGQRTRQAYDDFAIPARMTVWLSVLPYLAVCAGRRRLRPLPFGMVSIGLLAEYGRRRAGGRAYFPWKSSLLAPVWVLERGICAWLAVGQKLRFGGVRYGDSVIRVAAHSRRELRKRAQLRQGSRCP